jgi:hypothetical protein
VVLVLALMQPLEQAVVEVEGVLASAGLVCRSASGSVRQ